MPHVYNQFIGDWGLFPHHDQVPIYFPRQLYVEFVLDMRPKYTSTPSTFYGSDTGRSYDHLRSHRDPTHLPPPPRLFPLPCWRVVFPTKLEGSSQTRIKVKKLIANVMMVALDNAHVGIEGERWRSPPTPPTLTIPFVEESVLELISHQDLLRYVVSTLDAYYDLYQTCSSQYSHMVYTLNSHHYMSK